ncbi:SPASM domain-containing protein, partial [Candidatus Magnetobacterium casense]
HGDRIIRVTVSIDECDKEHYEKIRRGLDWDVLCANMKYLWSKCHKTFLLWVRCCVLPENKARLPLIGKKWKGHCSRFATMPEVPRPDTGRMAPVGGYVCSEETLKVMCIAWDGTMALCCSDWMLTQPIGHARDGIEKVWYGDKHRDLIAGRKDNPMCGGCR